MASRPEAARALVRAASTSSDAEVEHFYALRVSNYAGILALIFGGMYLLGVLMVAVIAPSEMVPFHLHPAKLANLGFALAALGVWWLTRRPHAPTWLVTASDVVLPVGVTLVVGLVGITTPPGRGLYFVPLLIAALLLVLRAALLPSAPSRTALVGALSSAPVVAASYAIARADSSLPAPLTPTIIAIACGAWCLALIGATVLVSRVIYGLHREIRSVKRLGQYVLGELIGEGGMGAVYRAEHAMLRRPTAVKVLLPERVGADSIARFEREVMLTARLTHPNTVAIYDYGRTPDGLFYYAMEYLDGLSLEQLVRRFGPQPPGRVIHVLSQMAGALGEAHAFGLIHRDIKPANVLFCERGGLPDVVKLLDFGLVKQIDAGGAPALTHTDSITGTPHYMAPEAIVDPRGVDHRVDLYGLGGVGFCLLTGRPPFEGTSVVEICGHHLHTPPRVPSEVLGAPVPADLEALILSCLAKSPKARPADALEVHDRLAACARTSPFNVTESRDFWRTLKQTRVASAVSRPTFDS
jgi:eukaryotic-like serine/threonine-protein kinase